MFQLGVTRAPTTTAKVNNHTTQKQRINGETTNNKSNTMEITTLKSRVLSNDINNDVDDDAEPESLQAYLKPANDDLTIAYSEGTQKADLLY